MLKSLARTAAFLAYFFITLEMLFMVTPFALYYYSVYAPLLSAPSNFSSAAWLPAFFLPHLSTEIVPSIGGLAFLIGLVGFLVGAIQIYYAKLRRRGVVKSGFYARVRHPQYSFLALAGLGLLIVWPRFILLIIYIHMLWFYYLLARSEEERMQSRYGDLYVAAMRGTPHVPAGRTRQTVGTAVARLGPQSAAETLCHLLHVIGGRDRRGLRVTAIKPSPDHSFGFLGRSCCHLIFAGRHKRA